MSLLEINNLNISYKTRKETIVASSNVNLTLERGQILGIVGESGSGKSTIANAIINLIDPPGEITSGLIKIDNFEFTFSLPKNKNLDRSTVKNITIGGLKTYLRDYEETKLEDKEKNIIIVEVLKRILLPISALLLILTASMLFFRDQRNNSFGSYVVGGFLGAFVFNLTQEFFFSMSLTIQSNIVAISLMPYLLLLIIFYITYKRI